MTSPYGTVAVTQDVDGISVDINVTLDDFASMEPYHFHGSTDKKHWALAFDIAGNPTVTFSNVTTGFTAQDPTTGPFDAPSFGSFDYAFKCTGCGPGYAGGLTGPLDFKVTASGASAGTVLTPSSFTPTGAAHFFTVDIVDPNNLSGNVADPGDTVDSPEPATAVLIGTALVGLAMIGARHARHL
jgi:hypothetical protein